MANLQTSLDDVFHALSDATRRSIVSRLSQGGASVSELGEPFGIAKPTLLQHIRVLERSGLIRTEKIGRVRRCEIQPKVLSTTEAWLAQQRAEWEARLDRVDSYVIRLNKQVEKKHAKKRDK